MAPSQPYHKYNHNPFINTPSHNTYSKDSSQFILQKMKMIIRFTNICYRINVPLMGGG